MNRPINDDYKPDPKYYTPPDEDLINQRLPVEMVLNILSQVGDLQHVVEVNKYWNELSKELTCEKRKTAASHLHFARGVATSFSYLIEDFSDENLIQSLVNGAIPQTLRDIERSINALAYSIRYTVGDFSKIRPFEGQNPPEFKDLCYRACASKLTIKELEQAANYEQIPPKFLGQQKAALVASYHTLIQIGNINETIENAFKVKDDSSRQKIFEFIFNTLIEKGLIDKAIEMADKLDPKNRDKVLCFIAKKLILRRPTFADRSLQALQIADKINDNKIKKETIDFISEILASRVHIDQAIAIIDTITDENLRNNVFPHIYTFLEGKDRGGWSYNLIKLEKMKKIANKIADERTKNKALYTICIALVGSDRNKAINFAEGMTDDGLKGKAFCYVAKSFLRTSQISEETKYQNSEMAKVCVQKAMESANRASEEQNERNKNKALYTICTALVDLDRNEAVKVAERMTDDGLKGKAFCRIANAFLRISQVSEETKYQNLEMTKVYVQKAMESADKVSKGSKDGFFSDLSNLLIKMADADSTYMTSALIDRLIEYTNKISDKTTKENNLNEISLLLAKKGYIKDVIGIISKLVEENEKSRDETLSRIIFRVFERLVKKKDNIDNQTVTTSIIDNATLINESIKDDYFRRRTLCYMAQICLKVNARDHAETYIKMAMDNIDDANMDNIDDANKVHEKDKLFSHISTVSTKLVCSDQEFLDEAYLNTAIEYADKISEQRIQRNIFEDMAIQLAEFGYNEEAIDIVKNKLVDKCSFLFRQTPLQETTFNNIAVISAQRGNVKQVLDAVYNMSGRKSEAKTLLDCCDILLENDKIDKAITVAKKIRRSKERDQAFESIGYKLIEAGRIQKAIDYVNKGKPFREGPKLEVLKYAFERSQEGGLIELADQIKQLIDKSYQEETPESATKKRRIENSEL